jgi:hypothetical protein
VKKGLDPNEKMSINTMLMPSTKIQLSLLSLRKQKLFLSQTSSFSKKKNKKSNTKSKISSKKR